MEHFLHEIEISNFKSIRHQKIEGCRRINVFIGYPNVGKSNVLEAIGSLGIVERILEQWPKHLILTDFIRLDTLPALFYNGVLTAAHTAVRTNLRTASFSWLDFLGHLEYSCSSDPHLNVGTEFNEDFQSESVNRSDSFITPVTEAEVLTILKGKVRRYIFNGFNRKSESRINKATLQFPFGENIASSVQLLPQLRSEISGLFADFGFKVLLETNSIKIFRELDDGSIFTLGLNSVADTLQRLIFHKAAIASNKNAVLLFEEPEAHMFPPYISKFTGDVMFDENDNQFFINTHSPFVINDFMENLKGDQLAIFVVGYKKGSGETVIRKLTDEELHEIYQYGIDLYYNLESYLEHEEQ